MNITYDVIRHDELNEDTRQMFGNLLRLQGKVTGDVYLKADRCKMICIARVEKEVVAIGGIKQKTVSDFGVAKANLPDIERKFVWELGYFYTKPEFARQGHASNIVMALLLEYGDDNLMASTEIKENPSMVKILERNGFEHYGKTWKSKIHSNDLGLYLKYK